MTISPLAIPHRLDPRAKTCRVVIETPHGSRAKLNFDSESGLLEVRKLLPAGMAFPLDFGFIPSTEGGDGGPLDMLVLAEEPLPPGCLATVRLLGALEAEQTEQADGGEPSTVRNDRIIARLAQSGSFQDIDCLAQLGDAFCAELASLFVTYNNLKGKRFAVVGTLGPDGAAELIRQSSRSKA